jgi:hypothetical protein
MRTVAARAPSGRRAAMDAPWPTVDRDREQDNPLFAGLDQLRGIGERADRNARVRVIDEPDLIRRQLCAVDERCRCDCDLRRPAAIDLLFSARQEGVGDEYRHDAQCERHCERNQ